MVDSVVGIFNLACSIIGTRSTIATEDEASKEAEECVLWYELSRDAVMEAAHWPSTRAFDRLGLLAERNTSADWVLGDPEPGYKFAYSLPNKMLRPWYLTNFDRFTLGLHNNERVAVMTDTEKPILMYSRKQVSVETWDAQLKMAVSHALASFIALKLTGKVTRTKNNQERANQIIGEARAAAANSREDQYESIPEWYQARGIGIAAPQKRFLYPYGALISVAEVPLVS